MTSTGVGCVVGNDGSNVDTCTCTWSSSEGSCGWVLVAWFRSKILVNEAKDCFSSAKDALSSSKLPDISR